MPINVPQQKQGSALGKLIGLGTTVAGVATGNPMLVAGGVSSLAGDTPIGKAAGAVETAGNVSKKLSPDATTADPLDKRIEQNNSDPKVVVHNALKMVNDPELPLSYEERMPIIESLLRAKHGVIA